MRYAANLLFEYGIDGRRAPRPLCERRIVLIDARTPKEALRRAAGRGRAAQISYRNADGDRFRIRFLGMIDLIELSGDDDEVYCSLFRTSRPEKHLKSKDELSVFRPGPKTIRSAWWAVPGWAAKRPRRRRTSSNEEAARPGPSGGEIVERRQASRGASGR